MSARKPSRHVVRLGGAAVALAALLLSTAGACSSSSSNGNAAESAAQGAGSALQEQNQPLPVFPTSAYRQELIEIEAIEALGTPTTSFFFPEGTTVVATSGGGEHFSAPPMKICASEGLPIPNTASLSNPQQVVTQDSSGNGIQGGAVIGQMDPNGVYTPASSSGTNVLCLTASGGTKLAYWEGPVFAESGSATWSDAQGIVDIGPSELPTCTIATARAGDGTGLNAGASYYHCVKAA